jgi:predicted enzyme related to lactoylglutathione lyase
MKGLKKIDAVLHRVGDIDEAIRFYVDVLGLRLGWRGESMAGLLFPGNDSELVLHIDDSLPNPNISFQVEDVDDFVEDYREKGYNVLVEPFDIRCGMCAVLSDPYGNGIEVMDLTKFDGGPRFDA